jgi:hypothetical protein
MIKKTLMAAAVASAMVSANTYADLTLQPTTQIAFATELFGTSNVILGGGGVALVYQTDAAIADDASATFTFTLDNGTFGANPALTANGGTMIPTLTAGGQGSSTATFTVANSGAFSAGAGNNITLTVPSIAGPDLSGNQSAASVSLVVSNTNVVADAYTTVVTQTAANKKIAIGSPAISSTVSSTTLSGIEVSDQVYFSTASGSSTSAVKIAGGFDIDTSYSGTSGSTDAKDSGGSTDFALDSDDTITFSLSGALAENAEICIVPATEKNCDNEIGTSTVTTSGASIVLSEDDVNSTISSNDIIYVVDGESNIPLTDFSYALTAQFDSALLGSLNASLNSGSLDSMGLYGLTNSDNVNIITRPGAADVTYVRVTNPGSEEATVYVQLTAQDGSDLGFAAMPSIAAGATTVYTSDDFAAASGSETWSGRARATLSSDQSLITVPLIRTNDVLTNQSHSD